jgi:hypothetical protein
MWIAQHSLQLAIHHGAFLSTMTCIWFQPRAWTWLGARDSLDASVPACVLTSAFTFVCHVHQQSLVFQTRPLKASDSPLVQGLLDKAQDVSVVVQKAHAYTAHLYRQ